LAVATAVSTWQAIRAHDAQLQAEADRDWAKSAEAQAKTAEAKAKTMRRQAERDLDKALNAMSDVLLQLDKKELAQTPGIDQVRHELVKYILHHYQNYIDYQNPDPELRLRTARTYESIGILYSTQREPDKARNAFVTSVTLGEELTREFPAEARYWHQLGHTRIFFWEYMAGRDLKSQATKEYRLAIKAFEEAVRLAPDDAQFLNNLAWYLATSDDPTVRDPARAVELARRA